MAASPKAESEDIRDEATSLQEEDKFWFLKNLPCRNPENFKNVQEELGEDQEEDTDIVTPKETTDIPKIVRFSPVGPDECKLVCDRTPLLLSKLRSDTLARKEKDMKEKRVDSMNGMRRFWDVHYRDAFDVDVEIEDVDDDDFDMEEECSSDDNNIEEIEVEDDDEEDDVMEYATTEDDSAHNPEVEAGQPGESQSEESATPTPPPTKRQKQRGEQYS